MRNINELLINWCLYICVCVCVCIPLFEYVSYVHLSLQSEERGTPSRRSKSEGPPVVPNGRAYPIATEIDGTTSKQVHNCQLIIANGQ